MADAAQLSRRAHHAIRHKAINDVVDAEAPFRIGRDEIVGGLHAETRLAALRIQTQQMVAKTAHFHRQEPAQNAVADSGLGHGELLTKRLALIAYSLKMKPKPWRKKRKK